MTATTVETQRNMLRNDLEDFAGQVRDVSAVLEVLHRAYREGGYENAAMLNTGIAMVIAKLNDIATQADERADEPEPEGAIP